MTTKRKYYVLEQAPDWPLPKVRSIHYTLKGSDNAFKGRKIERLRKEGWLFYQPILNEDEGLEDWLAIAYPDGMNSKTPRQEKEEELAKNPPKEKFTPIENKDYFIYNKKQCFSTYSWELMTPISIVRSGYAVQFTKFPDYNFFVWNNNQAIYGKSRTNWVVSELSTGRAIKSYGKTKKEVVIEVAITFNRITKESFEKAINEARKEIKT